MDPYEITHAPLLLKSLPTSQLAILMRLWAGESVSRIARSRGLHPSTIYRWMHNDPQFIAAMNQSTETYMKEINVRTAGIASRAMDSMSEAVDHHNLNAAKFMISRLDKLARGSMSPRVIAKRIRRRDQRIQNYLDAPDPSTVLRADAPARKPVITHELPPAQIPDAAAPAGGPPPDSSAPLNNPDSPPPAPETPVPGDA